MIQLIHSLINVQSKLKALVVFRMIINLLFQPLQMFFPFPKANGFIHQPTKTFIIYFEVLSLSLNYECFHVWQNEEKDIIKCNIFLTSARRTLNL